MIAGLVAAHGIGGDRRGAMALASSCAVSVAVLGGFGVLLGGSALPEGVLQALPDSDLRQHISSTLAHSPSVTLVALLSVWLAVVGRGRMVMAPLAVAAGLQLMLGSSGRLDAWAVIVGIALLARPVGEAWRARHWAWLSLAGLGALFCAGRVRLVSEVQPRTQAGRLLWQRAATLVGGAEPLVADRVGVLSWGTGQRIRDLSGVSDPELGHVDRRSAQALADALDSGWALTGIAGFESAGVAHPRGWAPVGEWRLPGSEEGLRFWAEGDPEALAAVLEAGEDQLYGVVQTLYSPGHISLDSLLLRGVAVAERDGGVGFFSAGEATAAAPSNGMLVVWVSGSAAGGRGPLLEVDAGEARREIGPLGEATEIFEIGEVAAGDFIVVRFSDDLVSGLEDRNAFLWRIEIR